MFVVLIVGVFICFVISPIQLLCLSVCVCSFSQFVLTSQNVHSFILPLLSLFVSFSIALHERSCTCKRKRLGDGTINDRWCSRTGEHIYRIGYNQKSKRERVNMRERHGFNHCAPVSDVRWTIFHSLRCARCYANAGWRLLYDVCVHCVCWAHCAFCAFCVCLNSEATYIQPNTLCAGFENSNRYRAIVAHIELLLEAFIVLVCVYSGKPKLFDTWCFHYMQAHKKNESLSRIRYVEKEMSVLKSRNSSIEIDQFRILVRLISKWCDVIDSTACKFRMGNIKWRYMTNFCHSLWYYLMLLLPVGFAKM